MTVKVQKREYYCGYCGYVFVAERKTLDHVSIKKITSSIICPTCNNFLKTDGGKLLDSYDK